MTNFITGTTLMHNILRTHDKKGHASASLAHSSTEANIDVELYSSVSKSRVTDFLAQHDSLAVAITAETLVLLPKKQG